MATEVRSRLHEHSRGMATSRHRSLVGRSGRKAFVTDKGLAKKNASTLISQILKKRFEQIELPSKLLDHFL